MITAFFLRQPRRTLPFLPLFAGNTITPVVYESPHVFPFSGSAFMPREMIFMIFCAKFTPTGRDPRPHRLFLIVDNTRVRVQAYIFHPSVQALSVRTTTASRSPFSPGVGSLLTPRHDIADGGIATLTAAQDFDALDSARARIICHVQVRISLNHRSVQLTFIAQTLAYGNFGPRFGLFQNLADAPAFVATERTAFNQQHPVTNMALMARREL